MRFADEGEEHKYLAANEFIQELKKAPEWMLNTDPDSAGLMILKVRDRPLGPWTDYCSPDPLLMTIDEWTDFNHAVAYVAELRRQERTND